MIEVVTIAKFEDTTTANLAKLNLEAEGITAFLTDEATVALVWYLTVAVGWIKLQVPAPELERAKLVLTDTFLTNHFVSNDLTSDDDVRVSWADRIVERLFRVAVLGLLFPPLHLYSVWLLIRLLVSGRRVTRRKYWKVIIAMICLLPSLATLILFLR